MKFKNIKVGKQVVILSLLSLPYGLTPLRADSGQGHDIKGWGQFFSHLRGQRDLDDRDQGDYNETRSCHSSHQYPVCSIHSDPHSDQDKDHDREHDDDRSQLFRNDPIHLGILDSHFQCPSPSVPNPGPGCYQDRFQESEGLGRNLSGPGLDQNLGDQNAYVLTHQGCDPSSVQVYLDGKATPFTFDSIHTEVVLQENSGSKQSWVVINYCPGSGPQPSPTPSASPSPKPSPTASPSPAPSPTVTASPSPSPSPTVTVLPSPTPSPTVTVSPSPTPSPTVTVSPSPTPSPTVTPAPSPAPSPTATATPDPTPSPSPTATATPDPTPSPSPTATATPDPTPSPLPTCVGLACGVLGS